MGPFIFAIFFTGLVCNAAMAEQCNGPRQLPIHGKMLRGHIYEKLFARSGDAECLFICRKEVLCQSFNFVKTKSICEFNNRTKEAASPENFIDDKERYYVKLDVSRDIDECTDNTHNCSTNANCTNTAGSYTCTCHTNYLGDGKKCVFKRGLSQSRILRNYNSLYTYHLTSFLNPVLNDSIRSRFRRCWHAPSQGWNSSTFHSLCDAKGPTVTIIRVNNSIFGGYTDKSWISPSYPNWRYIRSTKAFVYSLKNPNANYDNQKFTIHSSYYVYATYARRSYGPTFGSGHVIYTSGNNGYTSCGYSYQLPPGSSRGRCPFYTGSSSFTISEIEVFYEELD
ncbi:uncharacterized protein [Montipora capricornis]|uniref:uncharacterized protein isoform X2 n=1 Tax=Montipora capricornis TaxID=246305 RepID=UPI0035F11A66